MVHSQVMRNTPYIRGPGTPEHLENMEQMAASVNSCLKGASVVEGTLMCNKVLEKVSRFSMMTLSSRQFSLWQSSAGKFQECCIKQGILVSCKCFMMFGISKPNFTGHYWDDYTVMKREESGRFSWCDKYITVIFEMEMTGEEIRSSVYIINPSPTT